VKRLPRLNFVLMIAVENIAKIGCFFLLSTLRTACSLSWRGNECTNLSNPGSNLILKFNKGMKDKFVAAS